MKGIANESVGDHFDAHTLTLARDKTLEIVNRVATLVQPGMTAEDVREILHATQEQFGCAKSWHPPQIRFGEDTLLPFGQKGVGKVTLKQNDIFFLDFGLIYKEHEGDVGRTFTVGFDAEMLKCCHDVRVIWQEVRDHWHQNKLSGGALYQFAKVRAEILGWRLKLEQANGHRIADFPHVVRSRGSIEQFQDCPCSNRWILEIQICHPSRPFGAFYEDLLN